tara:strand:- start:38926 stop:39720 length:795 start_codon:yes stop_codon:yes gene_type:complete
MKVATIVECREDMRLKWVFNNFHRNLPEDWIFQFFHSSNNIDYLKQTLIPFDREIVFSQIENFTDQAGYNALMKSEEFWERCIGDDILIFQSDTLLCDKSNYKIEDFMGFDYIGGWPSAVSFMHMAHLYPFGYTHMNGGLSFRKKSKMLKIVKDLDVDRLKENWVLNFRHQGLDLPPEPEDVVFSNMIKDRPKPKDVLAFSFDNGWPTERVRNINDMKEQHGLEERIIIPHVEIPFGLHQPTVFATTKMPELFKDYPGPYYSGN